MVTREWRKAKSAELEFALVSAFRDNSSFGLNSQYPGSAVPLAMFLIFDQKKRGRNVMLVDV